MSIFTAAPDRAAVAAGVVAAADVAQQTVAVDAATAAHLVSSAADAAAEKVASTAGIQEYRLRAAGQRRINTIWEVTQSFIAIAVVLVVLLVNAAVVMRTVAVGESQTAGLMQINVLGALVVGFYFGRTNHQRVGGVGADAGSTRGVA